jgi:hypothetical protein
MYRQKDEGVEERPQDERVIEHSDKILESDPFHRRHDVPPVEHQDEREDERVGDEGQEVNHVRKDEKVSRLFALADARGDIPPAAHRFHSAIACARLAAA